MKSLININIDFETRREHIHYIAMINSVESGIGRTRWNEVISKPTDEPEVADTNLHGLAAAYSIH